MFFELYFILVSTVILQVLYPGGVTAISRGLSAATPPESDLSHTLDPGRGRSSYRSPTLLRPLPGSVMMLLIQPGVSLRSTPG